jgi:uncharacterized protein (DUF1810 family)
MFDLDRFKQAQAAPHAGIATAMAELRAGRKTSHWIWYVFPQLAGLGRSPMATRYGLAGLDEASAYLRDPLLGGRLAAAAAAVRAHVAPPRAARLNAVMGSSIDALKLVSSMTLFRHVAARLNAEDPRPEFAALADDAEAILTAAATQGYVHCAFTIRALADAAR